MFVVTNREVFPRRRGFDMFGKKPAAGADTLRLVEATGSPGNWRLELLKDRADEAMKARAGLSGRGPWYASDYAAALLREKLRGPNGPRNLLFFVHGFNNDVESVLDRAWGFEQAYGVEVVPFSWPANGGGAWGVASNKSDKRDALNSTGALDRCIERIGQFIEQFNEEGLDRIRKAARLAHPDDKEQEDAFIAREMARACPIRVSMLLHSMGNYLFKHLLQSSTYHARDLVFENVILAAADTNNLDHARWVDEIRCRNRVYITINEDDSALRVSRMKAGDQQRARLGHYTYGLDSSQGVYVNFTKTKHVGDSHAYFEGEPVEKNPRAKAFFQAAVNGETAETPLPYNAAKNLYGIE
ncbi:MAG: alpha/beta hydrolase [Candidatus Hydrogenedentes bacterium]|nr:alpha/beta hydrolase [Candidatus Hydrogenedentota bacterium]